MDNAREMLKERGDQLVKLLTRTHHKVLQDFLVFKERNDKLIDERETLLTRWVECEKALALRTPVREAEYALDDWTPFRLYDCLLPMIKEKRRFIVTKDMKLSANDYKAI